MSSETRERINALFRANAPPRDKFLAGMTQRANEFDKRFMADAMRRARIRKAFGPTLSKLHEILPPDAGMAAEMKELREIRRTSSDVTTLKVPQVVDRLFSGSIGATYGPPYDVQWSWSQTQGNPVNPPPLWADANSGTMRLQAQTTDDTSAVAARAAVGNYLHAPLGTSTMSIFAAPSFSWSWNLLVNFNWAESAGWLGFVVESFDRQGNYIETILSQQIAIWDQQKSFLGGSWDNGSTSGYPLQAQFQAIEGLWYTVWVWFGVYAAEGDNAYAWFLDVNVPSFTWRNG